MTTCLYVIAASRLALRGGRARRVARPGAPVGPHAQVPAVDPLDAGDAAATTWVEEIDEVAGAWLCDRRAALEARGDADAVVVIDQVEIDPQHDLAGRRIIDGACCAHIRALPN